MEADRRRRRWRLVDLLPAAIFECTERAKFQESKNNSSYCTGLHSPLYRWKYWPPWRLPCWHLGDCRCLSNDLQAAEILAPCLWILPNSWKQHSSSSLPTSLGFRVLMVDYQMVFVENHHDLHNFADGFIKKTSSLKIQRRSVKLDSISTEKCKLKWSDLRGLQQWLHRRRGACGVPPDGLLLWPPVAEHSGRLRSFSFWSARCGKKTYPTHAITFQPPTSTQVLISGYVKFDDVHWQGKG